MPRLTPAKFEVAYMVLEEGREYDKLTPDQQQVLNEAHVVVQELEDHWRDE